MTAVLHASDLLLNNGATRPIASDEKAPPGSCVALAGRTRSGDRQAAAALLRQMQDRWYRYCLAQLRRPHEAEDATQEVALRVLRGLGRLRDAERFETWSFGVAVNVCRESRRRSARHAGADVAAIDPPAPETPTDDASLSRLDQALAGLTARQREAVTLRYLQGLSVERTAAAMRCRPGTVKATVFKALRSMRAHLKGGPS